MNELLFPVVLMSLVVVMLSMCSPVEFIVYDSHWSSFAVLCLVLFVGVSGLASSVSSQNVTLQARASHAPNC